MTHIAIQEKLDGKDVEWLEKVTAEQYKKDAPTRAEKIERTWQGS